MKYGSIAEFVGRPQASAVTQRNCDANLQGLAVTDPLDFQFAESRGEPVTEVIGAAPISL